MAGTELTPTKERVEALRDHVGPGPVIMLNLLKYREPDGREKFANYGALSGPILARQSGGVFDIGGAGPTLSGETWDNCVMIRFPDIEAFIGLAADPEYLKRAPGLREASLERSLWMVPPRAERAVLTRPSPDGVACRPTATPCSWPRPTRPRGRSPSAK
ncbi:MAG: DUF1330 domain-containing protein [bacterium]|nr:DUF1330 domain-containing protein [bacterium]